MVWKYRLSTKHCDSGGLETKLDSFSSFVLTTSSSSPSASCSSLRYAIFYRQWKHVLIWCDLTCLFYSCESVPNPAPLGLIGFGLTTALLQVKHARLGGEGDEDLEGIDAVVLGFAMFFGGLLQVR